MIKKLTALFSILTLGAALSGVAYSQNKSYTEIKPTIATADADKVEVIEYFWFGCPHCFRFEPDINQWAESKPSHVEFIREAPPLNRNWRAHSEAFYAAQVMGVTDIMFEPFFNAIHVKRQRLNTADAIGDFVTKLGIDGKAFMKTMKSFEVDKRIRQAMQKARDAGISSVPSVVINGKYLTSGSMAGSNKKVIQVMKGLIAREYKAMN